MFRIVNMEEVHNLDDDIELVVQFIPETGESNFQYILFRNAYILPLGCEFKRYEYELFL